jgi:transcriptional regulator with XRE-family HTH domain
MDTEYRKGDGFVEKGTIISQRILQLCRERDMTVGKLSSTAGTTASTVHDIVTGTTKNPRVFTLKKLCDALGITLSEFFNTPEFNNMEQEIE